MSTFFTKCPYNCSNGKVFNVALKRLEPCPHCMQIREEEIKLNQTQDKNEDTISLCEKFNLRRSLVGLNFDMDMLIPDFLKKFIVPSSYNEVSTLLNTMLGDISIRENLTNSLILNLGTRVNYDLYAYHYIMRAYKAGMSVVPYISARELYTLRQRANDYVDNDKLEYNYDAYTRSDVCIIFMDSGITTQEIKGVHGLMLLRSQRDLPTLVFMTAKHWSINLMLNRGTNNDKSSAKLVTLRYQSEGMNDWGDVIEMDGAEVVVDNESRGIDTADDNIALDNSNRDSADITNNSFSNESNTIPQLSFGKMSGLVTNIGTNTDTNRAGVSFNSHNDLNSDTGNFNNDIPVISQEEYNNMFVSKDNL